MRFETGQVFPMEADSSFIRRIDSGDDVKEGGLSGTIGADQSHNLSILHVKGDIREHSESTKMECDPSTSRSL
jgi:hypothetical protein